MSTFFISYVYEDRVYKEQILDWHKRRELGHWVPACETEDMRTSGYNAIRRHLNPLIRSSSALVLLVGDNNHNHEWIQYEVANAMSAGIPVIPLRLPNTTGALPASVRHMTPDRFSPTTLLSALGR